MDSEGIDIILVPMLIRKAKRRDWCFYRIYGLLLIVEIRMRVFLFATSHLNVPVYQCWYSRWGKNSIPFTLNVSRQYSQEVYMPEKTDRNSVLNSNIGLFKPLLIIVHIIQLKKKWNKGLEYKTQALEKTEERVRLHFCDRSTVSLTFPSIYYPILFTYINRWMVTHVMFVYLMLIKFYLASYYMPISLSLILTLSTMIHCLTRRISLLKISDTLCWRV